MVDGYRYLSTIRHTVGSFAQKFLWLCSIIWWDACRNDEAMPRFEYPPPSSVDGYSSIHYIFDLTDTEVAG